MGIVDIALSQEGTSENGTNVVKYNDWYYGRKISGGSYPWCAVFVSWCAHQAGVSTSVIPKTASVSVLYSFFLNKKLFQPKGNGYIPRPGDILIQKSGGVSHTGFVYSADSTYFYTIEGNAGDAVTKRKYKYDDSRLTGFGTPNYGGVSPLEGTVSLPGDFLDNTGSGTASGTSLGVSSYKYTKYTVKKGDTLQSLAQKYNCTPAMIVFVNNLSSNTLKTGQTIYVPTSEGALSNASKGVGTITRKHTTSVTISHPVIEVLFYTETSLLSTVSTTGLSKANLESDLISVNTIRSQGQDCPTFSLNLVWRNNWYERLSSNDLVIIKMQRPPEKKSSVFFGLIDDIRKSTDYSSGVPQRVVQVTGRGFNKALLNFGIGLVEQLSLDYGTGFMANQLNLVGVDSYDAIKLVLDSYIGKSLKYSFGNGKSFKDYFAYSGNKRKGEILCDITSYNSYVGSLWNFIKELGNPPFNETYWEVKNERPTLIHRQTPFNKADWIKLNRQTIKDHDIVSDNTGRSDLETYTLFSVQSMLFDETSGNYYFPLWYPPYCAKYGINQLSVSTVYQLWDDEDLGVDTIKQYFIDLFNFNIKNNVFHNGTLTVKGKSSYRIGERVIVESDGIEYYVESVTHNFNCYGSWTTSLGVTRGIQPEKRFTAPWGCAEEFTPAVMQALINQTSGEKIDWKNLPEYVGSNIPVDIPTGSSGSSSNTSQNEEGCFNYFKNVMKLNNAACAGILANINAESGFRTGALGDNGTSFGICQWHKGRFNNLKSHCIMTGKSYQSLEGQLSYLNYELENSYSNVLRTLRSVPDTSLGAYQAAHYWCYYFEVPANREQKSQSRGNLAKTVYYPKYSNR